MNAVDTSVFVYAVDSREPAKQAKAIELLDQLVSDPANTVLPWQVAGEFLCCMRRWQSQNRISQEDVDAYLNDILSMFSIRFPSRDTLLASLDFSSRFNLSHWDSMLLAACKEAEVETLYTEDLDSGTAYDSLKVINPFT